MIIHPPAVEPNSQLQLRLCRRAARASLGRKVQFKRYLALELKLLSLVYPAAPARRSQGVSRRTLKVDGWLCSTVFFQDHA